MRKVLLVVLVAFVSLVGGLVAGRNAPGQRRLVAGQEATGPAIPVHETGVANVNVTGGELDVRPLQSRGRVIDLAAGGLTVGSDGRHRTAIVDTSDCRRLTGFVRPATHMLVYLEGFLPRDGAEPAGPFLHATYAAGDGVFRLPFEHIPPPLSRLSLGMHQPHETMPAIEGVWLYCLP